MRIELTQLHTLKVTALLVADDATTAAIKKSACSCAALAPGITGGVTKLTMTFGNLKNLELTIWINPTLSRYKEIASATIKGCDLVFATRDQMSRFSALLSSDGSGSRSIMEITSDKPIKQQLEDHLSQFTQNAPGVAAAGARMQQGGGGGLLQQSAAAAAAPRRSSGPSAS